ncbi:Wzz/FepE/Etk N-terminal domain-containing protein [Marinobacter sp. OP 3.4]|uniref:Wzz/FepE/Etk N-terminal domain-containing protein n=1 Tax=Marinobacter sp. OP 3.4 TaxID=3076501 RepID=UPI002E1E73F6
MSVPNYEQQPAYDDEISLVDLATTLIRRRYVIYAVFGGTVLLALFYAFFVMAEVREYVTLVQLGEDDGKALESPSSVIANVESHWYPDLRGRYRAENDTRLPFDIRAENPENTHLVKLTSKATAENVENVETQHQALVDRLTERQTDLLNRQKQELEERVASLRDYLEELSGMEATGEAQAELIQQRARMLSEIENTTSRIDKLQPAEVLVVARESAEPKGPSKALVLALAAVLGGMVGIFAAFMAEFISHVRKAMTANSP